MTAMQVKQLIQQLRRSLHAADQSAILQACSGMPLNTPAVVLVYHDLLLFLCAFPADHKIAERAAAEMQRLILTVEQKKKHRSWSWALQGSGIAHTLMQGQFSAALTEWLITRYPAQVSPAGSGADKETIARYFQELLPAAEFQDSTQHELGLWKRVQLLCGEYRNHAALRWVMKLSDEAPLPQLVRDRLYDSLQLFVQLKTDAGFSRSFLHMPFRPKDGEQRVLSLTDTEREKVLDVMKASLCFYFRETDPVTYGDPAALKCYDRGGGTVIALTGMLKDRQLALESYIGFMVFQHEIPVAYGGGWIFARRCRIGVNIYPPFRGAGSARIFQQVLDLYREVFQLHRFLVRPYQFGKGNPDGIRSGAFWFYYKLGFRPESAPLRKLAAEEWEKIKADKKYRTPVPVLRQFTGSRVVLKKKTVLADESDPGDLSSGITAMIRTQFAGDRTAAKRAAMQHLRNILRDVNPAASLMKQETTMQWALLLWSLGYTKKPSLQRSSAIHQLLRYKAAGDEMQYQLQLQQCMFLFE